MGSFYSIHLLLINNKKDSKEDNKKKSKKDNKIKIKKQKSKKIYCNKT
jgi:hypothetical protein